MLKTVRQTVTFREGVNLNLARGLKRLQGLNNLTVDAGIIEGKSRDYPDGTSIVEVATAQEQGDEDNGIPSRPWLRVGFDRNRKFLEAQMEEAAEAILLGRSSAARQMALVGQQAVSMQRSSLAQLQSPPLSPVTIERKAADRASGRKPRPPAQYSFPVEKPLIETGHLIQQHVWVVSGD